MATAKDILGTNSVNSSTGIFKCADRVSPGDEPRDITAIKALYIPFDISHNAVHLRKNPFGAVIYRNKIAAGNVYHAFDGKRLVLELGCNTVIYIHINSAHPSKHHRIFIQSESAFSGDTTIRRDAAIIAHNTQHIETIVKYEMYFILGVISTASLAAWMLVTGSDVTVMYARNRMVAGAATALVKKLTHELESVTSYAPVLHAKRLALILSEGENNAIGAVKKLPETIIEDEKVQAQVAGVIFGKWAMPNGNSFNLWTVIGVILTQAATNSVTKYGQAYISAIESRYMPLIEDMRSVNPAIPSTLQKPVLGLIKLMNEAGVDVTPQEATTILTEISNNKMNSYNNLYNITLAIDEFRKVANK